MPAKRLNAVQNRYVDAIAEFSGEDRATVLRLFFKPASGNPATLMVERRAINGVGKGLQIARRRKEPDVERLRLIHEALIFAFERRHGQPFKKPPKRTKPGDRSEAESRL